MSKAKGKFDFSVHHPLNVKIFFFYFLYYITEIVEIFQFSSGFISDLNKHDSTYKRVKRVLKLYKRNMLQLL